MKKNPTNQTRPQDLNLTAVTATIEGVRLKSYSKKPCLSEDAVETPKGWRERGWRDIAVSDGGGNTWLSWFICLGMAQYWAQGIATPFLLSACWWSLSERRVTGWSSLCPAVSAAVQGDVRKAVTRQSSCRAVGAFAGAHLGHFKTFHEGEASLLSVTGETKFSLIREDNCAVGEEWRWGITADWVSTLN